MQLLIDADACPVTELAMGIAKEFGIRVTLVCDDAHEMHREGAETITVLRGEDSADFRLVNLLCAGDVVVTQDYGLAAMCLARGAHALSQNGLLYTGENIDGLLGQRHVARKLRRSGGRTKGPPKRTAEQDKAFAAVLRELFAAALTVLSDML